MNPVFTKRYKAGNRPNILPTDARGHGHGRFPNRRTASGMATTGEAETESNKIKLKGGSSELRDGDEESSSVFVSSKSLIDLDICATEQTNGIKKERDSLGQAWTVLSPSSNKVINDNPNLVNMKYENTNSCSGGGDMAFSEVFDDEIVHGSYSDKESSHKNNDDIGLVRMDLNKIVKVPIRTTTKKELKRITTGNSYRFSEGWMNQSFVFNTHIPYGLVQKHGGACGVLAVVQSLIIRNMLFGNELFGYKGKIKGIDQIDCRLDNNEEFIKVVKKNRVQWLVDSVAEIIWKCGSSRDGNDKNGDDDCYYVILSNDCSEAIQVNCVYELRSIIHDTIQRMGCVGLVYSAVLSRGIERVIRDMDFEDSTLIGAHGYCTQELINLFVVGKAISNTFDNDIEVDGKVLKGISKQVDVGLLSLFEYYGTIKVGEWLKCPKFPIWIVCSESHYSVLYSRDVKLMSRPFFDVYYYDGFDGLNRIVRLSIRLPEPKGSRSLNDWSSFGKVLDEPKQSTNATFSVEHDDDEGDLVPPLEKCLKTKWGRNAEIDWNGSEPIL